MKTDSGTGKKVVIKVASQEQHENVKNTRRTLKVLQQVASDKENLVGRPMRERGIKLASIEKEVKHKKSVDKSVQTDEYKVTIDDLTSDEPSEEYWRKLAEKRGEVLNESLQENERLKENIEALQEENRICKEMLEESKAMVEVLQDMIGENDTSIDTAEELTED